MKKLLFCLAMASFASLALMPDLALAQKDAGAKGRGEHIVTSVVLTSFAISATRSQRCAHAPSRCQPYTRRGATRSSRRGPSRERLSCLLVSAWNHHERRRGSEGDLAIQSGYLNAGTKALGNYGIAPRSRWHLGARAVDWRRIDLRPSLYMFPAARVWLAGFHSHFSMRCPMKTFRIRLGVALVAIASLVLIPDLPPMPKRTPGPRPAESTASPSGRHDRRLAGFGGQ